MKKHRPGKFNRSDNRGFTLVELIVSMTLTAIFATAIVAIMPSATRVFMRLENISRAQIVADMVVDSLREECESSYIEDYASARIISIDDTGNGSSLIGSTWGSMNAKDINASADTGNVLLLRKSGGYCEALYSNIPITVANRDNVRSNDQTLVAGVQSSRAVYRLFTGDTAATETRQGYVHFAYYKSAFETNTVAAHPEDPSNPETADIKCVYPYEQYDYTTPFPADAYNGYIVDLEFSDLTYTTMLSGSDGLIYKRPSSVNVTVRVYKSDYSGRSKDNLLYTRTARLVFSEDTTK